METIEFYVTDNPPDAGQAFGGNRPGRVRSNPFDQPIRQSHDEKFVDRDEWLEFRVDPADITKYVNRIRAAGQYLKLGTEVRVDKTVGRIAFRGVEYKPRTRSNTKSSNTTNMSVVDSTQPTGAADAQPWAWDRGQSVG